MNAEAITGWADVEKWRLAHRPDWSRAALMREVGISETNLTKGLKRGGTMQPSTRRAVKAALAEIEQGEAA